MNAGRDLLYSAGGSSDGHDFRQNIRQRHGDAALPPLHTAPFLMFFLAHLSINDAIN